MEQDAGAHQNNAMSTDIIRSTFILEPTNLPPAALQLFVSRGFDFAYRHGNLVPVLAQFRIHHRWMERRGNLDSRRYSAHTWPRGITFLIQRWYVMRHGKASAVILFSVTVSACGGGSGDDADTFIARDSAGIHIVENLAPMWGEGDAWQLSQQPLLDIGGQEGDPKYELYRASSAVRLPAGRLVIGNNGTNEIRFYDESGVHLLDAGGEGEGPGEFSFIAWVGRYRGDSIAAYDMRLMRISVFDATGQFARSFPVRGMDASGRGRAYGLFEDGSVFVGAASMTGPDGGSEDFRQEEPLYTVSPEGESGDELFSSPGDEAFMYSAGSNNAGNSMVFFGAPMFGRSTEYAIHGNRLFVAANDTYEIRIHERDGTLQSIVRRQHDFLEVTDADIEALREEQLNRDLPPGLRETMVDVLDATPIRETMPAFDRVLVDRIGNLWVEVYRRPGGTVQRWTVFDTQGVLLGTLAVPDGFAVMDVGDDYVLGRWMDDLEIEHVQIYELIKP